MNVEIINVGTELLLGEIVNTNAAVLEKMCREFGFNVYYQTTVGDNCERVLECFKQAFLRGADMVITTGGLGPTPDDLTKELSAQFLNLEMVFFKEEAKLIDEKCRFVTGVQEIPQNNFKQAYFPKDAIILDNPVGTTSGCVMSDGKRMIINLPGPPKELNYVVTHSLHDYLMSLKQESLFSKDIVTRGIGESMVAVVLEDIIAAQNDVTIALYASEEHVRVRLATKAYTQKEADEKMRCLYECIKERLKSYLVQPYDFKMPSYKVRYHDDFRFRASYLNDSLEDGLMVFDVYSEKYRVGTLIRVEVTYKEKHDTCYVRVLGDPSLSYQRIEATLNGFIASFLKEVQ